MISWNYLTENIMYYILRLFWAYLKKHGEKIDNRSISICVNEIENRIIFKIKTGCYLGILTPEMMKLLGINKNEITNDEINENVPHIGITEVVLVYCNVATNDYQQDSGVLYAFIANSSFRQLLDICPKNFIFLKLLIQSFHILKYGVLIKLLNR